jgi:hypothetical protein
MQIWILPETPTRLAPLLNNLTFVGVHRIHPNSGITWTLFLLEAAPLLKMLSIKVLHSFFILVYPTVI